MEHRTTPRVSLACLTCRNQHLKCDASRPICARCRSLSKSCSYPESRRSGKHRSLSAWKSQRRAVALNSQEILTPSETISHAGDGGSASSEPCVSPSLLSVIEPVVHLEQTPLDLYFEYFRPSHPFVLPRAAVQARLDASAVESPTLRALISVMEYIGSFVKQPCVRSDIFCNSLASDEVDGFTVQTSLLMALAKSMCDDRSASEELLAQAIQQAKLIGMHRRDFADAISGIDPVLSESWRRTWWMLCLTDVNFSVIRRDFTPIIADSEHDVDLPCDDDSYRRMDIPSQTATLFEYHNREYALEDKPFSSFAYLIDSTHIFVASLRASTQYQDVSEAEILCSDLEARVISWFLLLPFDKRELPMKPGLMDQLMFQAHMMMYTSLAFIHRPLSTLRYDPAEGISTCGPPPPPLDPGLSHFGNLINNKTHSEKLFQAIRKQNQCLILLPMRAAQLSPFVICMVACCTIAYLVASKLAFKAEEAEAARSRIRVSLATLKHYEDIWPRAKKILTELKRIAQSILQPGKMSSTPSAHLEPLIDQDAIAASFFDKDWLYAFENAAS